MAAPFLPLLLVAAAQATAAAPPAVVRGSPPPDVKAPAPAPEPRCGVPTGENAIIICAERSPGYRINPDILEAKREMKSPGAPRPNHSTLPPDCKTVGPAPCVNAGINLLGAAVTAAEMAKRLAEGKEIGSMFQTDPHPNEYQLYQMAKERREAAEAEEQGAKAKAKAEAAAKAAATAAAPGK